MRSKASHASSGKIVSATTISRPVHSNQIKEILYLPSISFIRNFPNWSEGNTVWEQDICSPIWTSWSLQKSLNINSNSRRWTPGSIWTSSTIRSSGQAMISAISRCLLMSMKSTRNTDMPIQEVFLRYPNITDISDISKNKEQSVYENQLHQPISWT